MISLFLRLIIFSSGLVFYWGAGCPDLLQADENIVPQNNLASVVEQISQMDTHDMGSLLGAVGVSENKSFDLAKIFGYFIFSGIGFVAFVYGKKNTLVRAMLLGVVLSIYPYFISSTLWIYIIGTALTVALFVWRD